jgi:acetyltransferase-like isoleucine patch superfamily enzyme
MAVPGLYAAWLRAWGSTVGAHVHFSPGMVVFDRSLLRIGDRVTFGFGVRVSAHVVKPTAGGADLLLVVRRVVIGDGAFIGAGAALGPGATIQPGALVAPGEVVFGGAHRGGGA